MYMLYENNYENLLGVVREMAKIKREQLVKFFAPQETRKSVNKMIEVGIAKAAIIYDEKDDLICWRGAVPLKKSVIEDRIFAFWVIAAMGCDKVSDFSIMSQPAQYFVLGTNFDAYDITIVKHRIDAQVAYRRRHEYTACLCQEEDEAQPAPPSGAEEEKEKDLVYHIALLPDVELEDQVNFNQYGFKATCVLDKDHVPAYTPVV